MKIKVDPSKVSDVNGRKGHIHFFQFYCFCVVWIWPIVLKVTLYVACLALLYLHPECFLFLFPTAPHSYHSFQVFPGISMPDPCISLFVIPVPTHLATPTICLLSFYQTLFTLESKMPIAYSTTAGAKDPDRALWIDEYVTLLDAGLLSVFDIFYGFKAHLSKDQLDLGPDQCIELVRKDFPAGLDKFRPKGSHEHDSYGPLSISCADFISRHRDVNEFGELAVVSDLSVRTTNTNELRMSNPTLQVNGQDPDTQEGAPGANGTIAATRKSLHQNIIGKLRPLPFQYRWTIWHDKHTDSENYENRLYVLHEDVADIATFYRVYNNYPWDKIRLRDSVHIFRKGVKPVWEDPENLNGGCWTFRVPKAKAQAFFHEIAILCMANEFQAAIQEGINPNPSHARRECSIH